jgi:hypothetical protein
MKKQIQTGEPPSPRSVFFSWLLQPDQKPSNRKNRFVENPLSAPAFGQNKTLTLCQNNVVINRELQEIAPEKKV